MSMYTSGEVIEDRCRGGCIKDDLREREVTGQQHRTHMKVIRKEEDEEDRIFPVIDVKRHRKITWIKLCLPRCSV